MEGPEWPICRPMDQVNSKRCFISRSICRYKDCSCYIGLGPCSHACVGVFCLKQCSTYVQQASLHTH